MNRISVSTSRGASRASEIPFTHRVILPNLSARVVTRMARQVSGFVLTYPDFEMVSGLVLAGPDISRSTGL